MKVRQNIAKTKKDIKMNPSSKNFNVGSLCKNVDKVPKASVVLVLNKQN